MATTTFGTLKEFNSDNESVKSYLERVDLYFRATSVEEDKQVPILLSSIGSATYTLLSDLLAPATPGTKSLEVITTTLRKHYEPKRAVIAERFHFHKRDQAVGESIMEYDAALRKLAIHCTFGTYLEEALRDRFVCGLRNEAMQRRLLSETDLTLTRAMELALGMETAEHNTRAFKGTDATIKKIREGPSLFGRNWLKYIQLDWKRIATVHIKSPNLEMLLQKHEDLFKEELGTIQPHKATLHVETDATPRFFRPQPVPFAIKTAVGQELDRLEKQGVLRKVERSDWAAPIVVVPKKDGKFRICGDYKVTINKALAVDQYPLPKPEDLFATLANGKKFTKLDLSQAYQQLLLDEASSLYVTINTHQGLYQYTRLPFGIASAPAMFQRLMDTVLQGIPGVICYIDDILVTGKDEKEHLERLEEVLQRLAKHGFRLKKPKCHFMVSSVEYLGHQIDQHGIQAIQSKVDAITKAPAPKNVQELRSLLGLINYYGKLIPNLSTILHPLNALLQASKKWKWTQQCTEAFQLVKDHLTSSRILTHYDPALPISLAADASAYGVGAVISHVLPDGSEHPVAYASRTLSSSERNYAQLEKEALAIIFGVKRFHQFLYGRQFTIIIDHKPLMAILGPKKGIPSLAAARLQRWAVLLSAYTYKITFKPTQQHSNADGLSRLPLPIQESTTTSEVVSLFNISQVQALPVTVQQVEMATRRDPILSKVTAYVKNGWPKTVPDHLVPYLLHTER